MVSNESTKTTRTHTTFDDTEEVEDDYRVKHIIRHKASPSKCKSESPSSITTMDREEVNLMNELLELKLRHATVQTEYDHISTALLRSKNESAQYKKERDVYKTELDLLRSEFNAAKEEINLYKKSIQQECKCKLSSTSCHSN